jgi:hypothetical protein
VALGAGALGCAVVAEDGALLNELSSDQMLSLCDELRDAVPGPDTSVTCPDGWTATVYTPTNVACRSPDYYFRCEATAGDMRSCAEAVRRDPCAAIGAPPAECAPFYTSTCLPWITASPVTAECPRADAEALSALEGVYELASHTRRAGSCEAAGESVLALDTEPWVVVVASTDVAGKPIAVLRSCATLASCRQAAAFTRDPAAVPPELDTEREAELEVSVRCSEGSSAVHSGHRFDFPPSDECRMIDTKTVVTRIAPNSLRLDTEIWEATDPDAPNGCYFGSGDRRASTGTCTAAEAHELRFLEAL